MGEILEFTNNITELKKLMNELIEKYEDLEDQLMDLEDFQPPEDNEKEFALWTEEYKNLEARLDELDNKIVEIQDKISSEC